jgi:hypothetical protein
MASFQQERRENEAMEPSRLHPVLIVAAISLTAFSATGIGVLTGVISSPRSAPEAVEQPLPAMRTLARPVEAAAPKPVEPVIEQPVLRQPAPAPKPRVERPAHRPIVRAAAPAPVEPVVFREFNEPPVLAQAPQPQAQLPVAPPAPAGIPGVVESVREVRTKGQPGGAGALLGGILGAVVGHGLGDGRKAATVLAAAGGAFAGHHIEKDATGTKRWEISVRLDDGTTRVLSSDVAPFWSAGDRVRFLDGRLQPV